MDSDTDGVDDSEDGDVNGGDDSVDREGYTWI